MSRSGQSRPPTQPAWIREMASRSRRKGLPSSWKSVCASGDGGERCWTYYVAISVPAGRLAWVPRPAIWTASMTLGREESRLL